MAAVHLRGVLYHLHSLAGTNPGDDCSDGQLLERFAATHDAAAFEAILRRHGPLVLSVCRRLLGAGPDVEDVFQATFLILARKAGSIRKQAAVASWLYGVAFRLARHLKVRQTSRPQPQQDDTLWQHLAEDRPMHVDPATRASLRELAAILDEELQRLPVKYREALVLCHLEGLSVAAAAAQLGWPVGTLKSRLLRGRELLRERLGLRGVALSAAGLAVALAEQAGGAAVPAGLLRAALDGGLRYADRPLPGNGVSVRAAALAESVAGAATVARLPLALAALAFAALFGAAAAFAPGQVPATPAAVAPAVPAQQPPAAADQHGDPLPPGALARLGSVRWRHGAPAHFVTILADGKTVVSASSDRVIHVWDLATGRELHRVVSALQLPVLPPGAGGTAPRRLLLLAAAASPNGKLLATAIDGPHVQLWELPGGQKGAVIPLDDRADVGALAFLPDGKQLVVAESDGPVRLWDLQAGKFIRTFEQKAEKRRLLPGGGKQGLLQPSPDGKMLTCAVMDGTAKLNLLAGFQFWSVETGKELFAIKMTAGAPTAPAFSPDGKLFAFGTVSGEVIVHQAADGKLIRQWTAATKPGIAAVVFGPDGSRLYTKAAGERVVCEWDVASGKALRRLPDGDPGEPPVPAAGLHGSLALVPGGKTLAVAGDGTVVRFLDLATGKDLALAGGHTSAVNFLVYAPDGKTLLTRGTDRTVRKWESATGKQLRQWAVPAHALGFAATPDGKLLAVEDDKHRLALVDAESGKVLTEMDGPGGPTSVIFLSPDGRTLVVRWPGEGHLTLFDVPSGKERCRVGEGVVNPVPGAAQGRTLDTSSTFFFSPDGRRLAVFAAPKTAAIYDTANGRLLQQFQLTDTSGVRGGTFSPDGRLLALETGKGTVSVVELANGKERLTLGTVPPPPKKGAGTGGVGGGGGGGLGSGVPFGPAGAATLAFAPDGRLLVQAGRDKSMLVWDVATGKQLARFEGHKGAVTAVAYAPDGRSAASASGDGTALVWDVQGFAAKAGAAPVALEAAALQANWESLAGDDGPAAHAAIAALAAAPKQTLPFLQTRLKPETPVAPAAIAKWIEQLDSGEFKVRAEAKEALLAAGDQVMPYADKVLAGKVPLEVRQALQAIQARLGPGGMTGERLRLVRAIEVLERIGNAEARQLLRTLAGGPPGALATAQARVALERMGD
jgi:RNA polymerase sigma factor (sigma-70 family)